MGKDLMWREAIVKVLSNSQSAMDSREITFKIVEEGLRSNLGATPFLTVNTQILADIKEKGENSQFRSVGYGLYIWRDQITKG